VTQAAPVKENGPRGGLGEQTVAIERSVPGSHGLVSVTGPVTFGNSRLLRDAAVDLVKAGQPWLLIDLTGCARLERPAEPTRWRMPTSAASALARDAG